MVDGLLSLDEDGHGALGKVQDRFVEEGRPAQCPIRVAFHSQPVLPRNRRARNLSIPFIQIINH